MNRDRSFDKNEMVLIAVDILIIVDINSLLNYYYFSNSLIRNNSSRLIRTHKYLIQ